jgi:hypothetical protein
MDGNKKTNIQVRNCTDLLLARFIVTPPAAEMSALILIKKFKNLFIFDRLLTRGCDWQRNALPYACFVFSACNKKARYEKKIKDFSHTQCMNILSSDTNPEARSHSGVSAGSEESHMWTSLSIP